MPPKKDAGAEGASAELIKGFDARECKLLAAAFVSLLGPDKYDYDLMATLTGNTSGSLKKMWPPVKRKAAELHESFGNFLGTTATSGEVKAAATPKKRKTTDSPEDEANGDIKEPELKSPEAKIDTKKRTPAKEKAASKEKTPSKPRTKKVKSETKSDSEGGENSADGGDDVDNKEVDE